jgi:hypothetical protein
VVGFEIEHVRNARREAGALRPRRALVQQEAPAGAWWTESGAHHSVPDTAARGT